jgi:CRISPR-associated protein Csx3
VFFKIDPRLVIVAGSAATLFRVGFGDQAQNDQIVREVEGRLAELKANGLSGPLALVNGPASLPVAVMLGHALAHQYASIAIFDPKMAGYVVVLSHGGEYLAGTVIPATDVVEEATS